MQPASFASPSVPIAPIAPSAPARYDAVSIAFHWLTAVVVTITFILGPEGFGRLMRDGVDPATRSDIVWHETLGLLVFALTLLRLIWVAVRPAVPRFEMAGWMRQASRATHGALWALMLILPLSALIALGSEGHPLTLLGGIRVEHLPLVAGSALARLADWGEVHGLLGDVIIWVAGAHAAAAIVHHLMLRDGVLRSMLPLKWLA